MISQNKIRLGLAENGSITALAVSGIRIMSLSLIAFQPAIDDPSNMIPSRNASSSMVEACWAVCCHLPRGSVNRRSTYSTELSLINLRTLLTSSLALCPDSGFFVILLSPLQSGHRDTLPVTGRGGTRRSEAPHHAEPP